ncbi:LysE family translocator [Aeromicrobium phragmitis]|uniref:LysE family translocator n=1 Tax=Aeromicrobium phragmitis TaxID=2478914 RepID=A0A3L8PPQ7_9ACTN|nr:LysE family translocator [Aeromicrobium phragmitis]RLV57395.1 LysE family translocator [Aeromicrobium phragmitis]
MSLETVIALLVFLFPLAYSPGPGNAFFAALAAAAGMRAAVPALVGYHAATLGVTALIGMGVGTTIVHRPAASNLLFAMGSAYVLWLAVTFVRHPLTVTSGNNGPLPRERRAGFWTGAVVLLLNPKAYSIIAAMFAQFLATPGSADRSAVIAIAVIFTLNNLVAFLVWASGGRALSTVLGASRYQRVLSYVFAAALVGVAAWMSLPLFT